MATEDSRTGRSRRPIPTLRDIADIVGVSPSTVSAVLNNAPRAQAYSQETKQRIRDTAGQLGYFPNPLAKTLKRRKSGLIGVVVFSQHSMYYDRTIQAAEAYGRQVGYELVTADMRYDTMRLQQCLQVLAAWRVEGVLVLTGGQQTDSSLIRALQDAGTPHIKGGIRQHDDPCSCVVFNNRDAGQLLATHLTELGHVRIGVLAAHSQNAQSEERLRGVVSVLEERAIPPSSLCVIKAKDSDVGLAAGYRYAKELLERQPDVTAVICMNDLMAIGAIHYFRDQGRTVPDDLSVTGHDDVCLDHALDDENRLGAHLAPPLTTVRLPLNEMGTEATRLLVDIIKDPSLLATRRTIEFSPHLIVRGSTGPVAPSKLPD